MPRISIAGQENIVRPALYMPNRLSLKTGRALHHLLGKRVCYMVDTTFPPAPEVMSYLRGHTVPALHSNEGDQEIPAETGEDKPVIEFFDFRNTTPRAVREQVMSHMEAGRSVVFLPGMVARARGCLADVPSPFLRTLASIHIAPIPVFVGFYGNSIHDLFSVCSRSTHSIINILPKLKPGPRAGERLLAAWMNKSAELFTVQPFLQGAVTTRIVESLRANPTRKMVEGMTGTQVSYGRILGLAMSLARVLKKRGEKRVGIILPPSPQATIALVACMLAGITPAMLNYTASREAFERAVELGQLKTFITEHFFVEKLPNFPWPEEGKLLFVSELPRYLSKAAIVGNLVAAGTLPSAMICSMFETDKRGAEDECVLLFTSGSSGVPKGVMLTHRMLLANAAQCACRIDVRKAKFLSFLPVFHSFGLTVTLILPLLARRSFITYPNPMDAQNLCKLIEEHKATFIAATPTFARAMLRRANENTFKSVQHFIVGAEKLPTDLDTAFQTRHGLKLLEGYGLTETAPVCTLNAPDAAPVKGSAFYIPGRVTGSVGALLPGIAARVTDVEDDDKELELTEQGMLWYKGANIFSGYLGNSKENENIFRDGWFKSGDLGRLDLNGFVTLRGRLSRFSKIGGEMVPHEGVERAIVDALGVSSDQLSIAITCVPDEVKGEAIVMLSTLPEHGRQKNEKAVLQTIRDALAARDFPNLWVPRYIVPVEEIPLLGSGKLDLKRCRQLAEEALCMDAEY